MKILLVNSYSLQESLAEQVMEFYKTVSGVINFEIGEKEEIHEETLVNSEQVASWDNLFKRLENYRELHEVDPDTFILLLTNEQNENNWFGTFDISDKPQGFIQTSYWDEMVTSESIYPILYEVIAIPFYWRMFRNMEGLIKGVHYESIGCINDFCSNKREIILKLQTGNICSTCYQKMVQLDFTDREIDHLDEILDEIRKKFRIFNINRGRRTPYPLRLVNNRRIYIGDSELVLSPIQKTLYLFFLNTEDSIRTVDLMDYEHELIEIYGKFYNGGDRTEMIQIAGKLARNEDGLTNQTVSRINYKIDHMIIQELAGHYKIITDNNGYKSIEAELINDNTLL